MGEEEQAIDRRAAGMERHFSTVAIALILGAILWASNSLIENGKTLSLLKAEVGYLKDIVNRASMDRYTKSNADSDKLKYDLLIRNLDRRMLRIERLAINKESKTL